MKELISKVKNSDVFKFLTKIKDYSHHNPWVRVLHLFMVPIIFSLGMIFWTLVLLWVFTLGGLPFFLAIFMGEITFESNVFVIVLSVIYLAVDIVFIVWRVSYEFKSERGFTRIPDHEVDKLKPKCFEVKQF